MKEIKGYVCVAGMNGSDVERWMFGVMNGYCNNFEVTGLVPYKSRRGVSNEVKRLEGSKVFRNPYAATIDMMIAETEEDVEALKEESSLVVVNYFNDSEEVRLFGPRTNQEGFDGRAMLRDNGLVAFVNDSKESAFEKADHVASEIARQTLSKVRMSTFRLERI